MEKKGVLFGSPSLCELSSNDDKVRDSRGARENNLRHLKTKKISTLEQRE